MADLLAQAIENLEAQEAMNNAATQRIIQDQLRAHQERAQRAAAEWDSWECAGPTALF